MSGLCSPCLPSRSVFVGALLVVTPQMDDVDCSPESKASSEGLGAVSGTTGIRSVQGNHWIDSHRSALHSLVVDDFIAVHHL